MSRSVFLVSMAARVVSSEDCQSAAREPPVSLCGRGRMLAATHCPIGITAYPSLCLKHSANYLPGLEVGGRSWRAFFPEWEMLKVPGSNQFQVGWTCAPDTVSSMGGMFNLTTSMIHSDLSRFHWAAGGRGANIGGTARPESIGSSFPPFLSRALMVSGNASPWAQNCTHRRYRYKDRVDEVERAKTPTKVGRSSCRTIAASCARCDPSCSCCL